MTTPVSLHRPKNSALGTRLMPAGPQPYSHCHPSASHTLSLDCTPLAEPLQPPSRLKPPHIVRWLNPRARLHQLTPPTAGNQKELSPSAKKKKQRTNSRPRRKGASKGTFAFSG